MSTFVRAVILLVVLGQAAVFIMLLRGKTDNNSPVPGVDGGGLPGQAGRSTRGLKGSLQSPSPASRFPPDFDPMPRVHMVYMYANGSDPGIVNARKQYGGPAAASSRDRDNGELRYSLRSLDKFAPWFKGDVIILQGDDQPPYWLNLSHPRVKVVNHHTYFKDKSVLPTFSSDAIHVNIHRIPPVQDSDILINWCDDFFLGRPVEPEDWVRDGKPVIYFEPNPVREGKAGFERLKQQGGNKWLAKIFHTRAVIEERFPEKAPNVKMHFVKHAPFPMSVEMLRQMSSVYEPEYTQTASFKFRTYDTVDVPTLHNYYCQVKDACVLDSQEVMDDAATLVVLSSKDVENYQKLLRAFLKQPPKFFTFNDGFGSVPPDSAKFAFRELLPAMFPHPSQYELADAPME